MTETDKLLADMDSERKRTEGGGFHLGDVVWLKSGGPPFTIIGFHHDIIICVRSVENGTAAGNWRAECLTTTNPETMTAEQNLHKCEGRLPDDPGLAGAAFESCVEDDDGSLWCSNGEYGTQVNFCPYCGFKAKMKAEIGGEYEWQRGAV